MSQEPQTRTVKLLRLGPDQVVEIPTEWEMPSQEVTIVKDGNRLVIAPTTKPPRTETEPAIDPSIVQS